MTGYLTSAYQAEKLLEWQHGHMLLKTNEITHSPTRFLNSILKFLFGLLFKTNTKQIIDNDGRWIRSAGFRSLASKTRCPYPPPTIIDYLSTLMNYYDNSYEQQDN